MFRCLRAGAAVLLTLPPMLAAQQQRVPLSVDEFLSLATLSDPRPSPEGLLVAFTVSTPSLANDRNSSHVWVVDVANGQVRQATTGASHERSPRWSPDAKTLAYISDRGGSPQIWRLPIAGGEPRQVTDFAAGVTDFFWSPRGKALFFTSDIPWPPGEQARRDGDYPTSARIWTSLFYRHWNEWRTGRRSHLFRVEVESGEITDLTPIDRDIPTLALGGRDLAISGPGTELAVVMNPDSSLATSTNNDIYVMGPDGSGRQPVTTNPANDHSPAYSPDSRYIAYLATETPGFESDRQQLILYERATGRRLPLTPDWDLSVSAFTWTPDARAILAQVVEGGQEVIYRIEVPSGRRTRIVGGGVNTEIRAAERGDLVTFLHQTASHPPEVWVMNAQGGGQRQLTDFNGRALERLALSPVERFGFLGTQGDSVYGWLMKPPGFDPSRRYPLVYLIHGGPQGSWLDEWHPRWNYAPFAARGYVVAAVDFHGSTGYGQRFTNSVSRHWGDYPYDDLMRGLDYLAALPYVDRDRMGAAGASYGGYMIYWMEGHTNRFKVMVAHDGIFNPLSFAGTTEELWFPAWEFGGTQLSPAARSLMEKWSPANFLNQWSTPLLVIHSQEDYRVDLSEGLQAFTALRLRGIPGKFLYFPDEGHFVTSPRDRRLWWNTVLDWLDRWLKPA